MNKIGELIYWEMNEVKSTKDALSALGIDRFIPRNDYKTSLIKALHQFTKGKDEMYRRFNDTPKSVQFTVFIENVDGEDMSLNKKITIKLDKDTGILMGADGTELIRMYDEEKRTIDSKQLRTILLKCVKIDCLGVSMKTGGGIYYVNSAHLNKSDEIIKIFSQINGVKFNQVPIFDNEESRRAVQEATVSDLVSDIESMLGTIKREYDSGALSKKRLEGKSVEIDEIFTKAKALQESLRDQYKEVSIKLKNIEKEIDVQIKAIDEGLDISESFLDRLLLI